MKKTTLFYLTFLVLIIAEFLKGLSANGTPAVFQDYDWQMDFAYFMWSIIDYVRIVLFAILGYLLWKMAPLKRSTIIGGILIFLLWGFFYWFFNHFWNGGSKFPPVDNPTFLTAAQNKVPSSTEIMGMDINGQQKAYPVGMIHLHHQFKDEVGGQPVWVTYCGLCRSGRVFDIMIDGQALDFEIVGAVNYNATFRDKQTGSWWRQEMGDAVKGKLKGTLLEDLPMEQMSLDAWLQKYPNSQILQYVPALEKRYKLVKDITTGEAELPFWYTHKEPPLIIGLEIGAQVKAYDWEQLKTKRLVQDKVEDTALLLLSSEDGISPFAYNRMINGEVVDFEINGDVLTDKKTQSTWTIFGNCIAGELEGTQLENIQIYQQNIRSWKEFHPESAYYEF